MLAVSETHEVVFQKSQMANLQFVKLSYCPKVDLSGLLNKDTNKARLEAMCALKE